MKYTLTFKDNETGIEEIIEGDSIIASAFIERGGIIFSKCILIGKHNFISRSYMALGAEIVSRFNTQNKEAVKKAQKIVEEEFANKETEE